MGGRDPSARLSDADDTRSALYRDVWFDKPPLVPAVYLLWGAKTGPILRLAGAGYAMLACVLAYLLAETLWGGREGMWAAGLLGFYLTFDTHSAMLPLAADMLLLAPHLAAILLAARKQAFWSGAAAGIGFLFNAKAVFVLAACLLFAWPGALALLAGFAIPNLMALTWLVSHGSLAPWFDQVWRWPAEYAASPIVTDPLWNGVLRTVNWLGFHAALAVGAASSGGIHEIGSSSRGRCSVMPGSCWVGDFSPGTSCFCCLR